MTALDGVRVLEFGQYEAGPAASQFLAWMGADVIKLERPWVGDPFRHVNFDGSTGKVSRDGSAGNSPIFLSVNSNKRSLVIDLQQHDGRDLLLEILPSFDIVVENLAPGTMDRLGLGYETLREVHPQLVYGSISGYGPVGPRRAHKSFDDVAQAAGGAMGLTTFGGVPTKTTPTVADTGSAMSLAFSVLAAYVERLRTNRGQRVDVSMQATVASFLRTTMAGRIPGTAMLPRQGGSSVFPCAPGGPNDYIVIFYLAQDEGMWTAFLQAIDRPALVDDPRFKAPDSRQGMAMHDEISKWTRQRTKHEAWQHLASCGIAAAAVQDTEELFGDPQMLAVGAVCRVVHPERGQFEFIGLPFMLDTGTVDSVTPAPLLGEHSREILSELGLPDSLIESLCNGGIVQEAPSA